MTSMVIGGSGELALPLDVQERYGLKPHVAVRLIETRTGLLLVPLTGEPMSGELRQEIEDWQALGQQTWAQFPYESDAA